MAYKRNAQGLIYWEDEDQPNVSVSSQPDTRFSVPRQGGFTPTRLPVGISKQERETREQINALNARLQSGSQDIVKTQGFRAASEAYMGALEKPTTLDVPKVSERQGKQALAQYESQESAKKFFPESRDEGFVGFINKAARRAYETFDFAIRDASLRLDEYQNIKSSDPISEKIGATVSSIVGAGGVAFSPVSAAFSAGEEIPILKYPITATNKVFQGAGLFGSFTMQTLRTQMVNLNIISEETSQALQPLDEAAAFAAQVAGGKGAHTLIKPGKILQGSPNLLKPTQGLTVGKPTPSILGKLRFEVMDQVYSRKAQNNEVTVTDAKVIISNVVKKTDMPSPGRVTLEPINVTSDIGIISKKRVDIATENTAVFKNMLKGQERFEYVKSDQQIKTYNKSVQGRKVNAKFEWNFSKQKGRIVYDTPETAMRIMESVGHLFHSNQSLAIARTFYPLIKDYTKKKLDVKTSLATYAFENLGDNITPVMVDRFIRNVVTTLPKEIAKLADPNATTAAEKFNSAIKNFAKSSKKNAEAYPELSQFIEYYQDKPGVIGKSVRNALGKAAGKKALVQDISKAKASGQSFDDWVKGQGESKRIFSDENRADILTKPDSIKKGDIITVGHTVGNNTVRTTGRVKSYTPSTNVIETERSLTRGGETKTTVERTPEGGRIFIENPDGTATQINTELAHFAEKTGVDAKTRSQLKVEWDKIPKTAQKGKTTTPIIKTPPWAEKGGKPGVVAQTFEGTGPKKTSKLAQGVEQKAIEKGLTDRFDKVSEYQTVNMKDQASRATRLLSNEPEKARRIALGQEVAPDGILPEAVFIAVENAAIKSGDVNTLRALATSSSLTGEASAMGQRIRTLAERQPDSPVSAINEIVKAREEAIMKKTKTTSTTEAKKGILREISSEVKKTAPKKETWSVFIESIKCT